MTFTDSQLLALADVALLAASDAAEIIAAHSGRDIAVQHKPNYSNKAGQVVTEVDHLCQERILDALRPTIQEYEIGFLAEESADDASRLETDCFWCVDPLDGTLPFIESTPGYAVSIGLVSCNGTPLIGVAHDPVTDTCYHAVRDHGAFRNGLPFEPPPTKPEAPLTVATGRSFPKHPLFLRTISELEAHASQNGLNGVDVVQHGGAVMNACWVLERPPACYVKYPTHGDSGGSLWDYAATACIFAELDMPCTDVFGNPLELNRPDSTFMNHRGIVYASSPELADLIRRIYASSEF